MEWSVPLENISAVPRCVKRKLPCNQQFHCWGYTQENGKLSFTECAQCIHIPGSISYNDQKVRTGSVPITDEGINKKWSILPWNTSQQ